MTFKTGQRIKYRSIRGTILATFKMVPTKPINYLVRLDNGANVMGTKHQFTPARRA